MNRSDVARWRHAERIYSEVSQIPGAEVAARVQSLCADDRELERIVLKLLAAHSASEALEPTASPSTPEPLRPATGLPRVQGYRLQHVLGQGGMSTVYQAERETEGVTHPVAVKIVRGGGDGSRHRLFQRERQLLARLEHPAIARFLDSGVADNGDPFCVLEYVEGLPIDRYCDLQQSTIRERLILMVQVCGAVQYAHQNLIVHRDLKPNNILIDARGRPKLLDFGIAKDLLPLDGEAESFTAERFLTPTFASPEQLRGAPATTTSDVYSLGLLLCVLLCGRLPRRTADFAAETRPGQEQPLPDPPSQLLRGEPLAPLPAMERRTTAALRSTSSRVLRRLLQGDLDAVVLRCLDPRPERRYTSVAQLLEDLHRHLDGRPILARSPSLLYFASKAVRRHPLRAAIALFALLSVLGYGALQGRHSRLIAQERDAARAAQDEAEEVTRFLADTFRLADVFYRLDITPTPTEEFTVRQALEYGQVRVHDHFQDRPRAKASLLNALGEISINLGDTDAALELLEEGLALRRQEQPPSIPAILETLSNLGDALSQAGRLQEAEERLRPQLEALEPPASPQEARAQAGLLAVFGKILLHQHHYPEARETLQRALELSGEAPGTDPQWLADTSANLGTALWLLEDIPAAAEQLTLAIELFETSSGRDYPGAASALQSMAYVQAIQGQGEAAVESIQRALAMRRRAPGPDHPETLATLSAVGEIYFGVGDLVGAERVLREVVDRDRHLKGPEHPDLALDLHSLAATLIRLGRLAEAEPFLQESIDLCQRIWGRPSHPVTGPLVTLADLRGRQQRYPEQEASLREVVTFRQETFAADHRLLAAARLLLADCLETQGRLKEACPYAEAAAPVLLVAGDRDRRRSALARVIVGSCLAEQGQVSAARETLKAAHQDLQDLLSVGGVAAEEVERVARKLAALP